MLAASAIVAALSLVGMFAANARVTAAIKALPTDHPAVVAHDQAVRASLSAVAAILGYFVLSNRGPLALGIATSLLIAQAIGRTVWVARAAGRGTKSDVERWVWTECGMSTLMFTATAAFLAMGGKGAMG